MSAARRIPFAKMHGAGNDLVIVDCLAGDPVADWGAFARFALDRRLGIGGDQLLLVRPSREADFAMAIRNADGSSAEMCANGVRAFAKYLRDRGLSTADRIRVETLAGIVTPRFVGGDQIEVEMTRPVLEPEKIPTRLAGKAPLVDVPLEVDGERLSVTSLSMGNPHCVVFVDDPEDFPVERLGPRIEHHPAFPERVNVEFVGVVSARELVQRTWERGSGETLACGSGACAAAVAGVLSGRSSRDVSIRLRGGALRIRWPADDGPVYMTGPAAHVFDGELTWP
ncbi:MAG TPA: diaminopimelate epimerase [Myxococcota bacterium]|nr:diaminopimelate epimerase [Myxococcota bacterium]